MWGTAEAEGRGRTRERDGPKYPQVAPQVAPEVLRLLRGMKGNMDRQTLQRALGLKAEKNFRLVYLRPALGAGLIEMTIPDKPRSSKQRYRITAAGVAVLATRAGGAGKSNRGRE